jgi:nucleotide-binding universal stress UspA family protein
MFRRILVGYDGSDVARQALRDATRFAKDQRAQLRIVSVVDLTPLYWQALPGLNLSQIEQEVIQHTQKELNDAVALAEKGGITPETIIARAGGRRVSDVLIEQAKNWPADLIVMGTSGRGGIERFLLGSVAEGVARSSPVPVMLVRGQ